MMFCLHDLSLRGSSRASRSPAPRRSARTHQRPDFGQRSHDLLAMPKAVALRLSNRTQGPTRPSQILGVVLEDALCELLMMHPPEVSSFEELKAWATSHVSAVAQQAMATGQKMWHDVLWKSSEDAWSEVDVTSLEERLQGGLGLFFEEVKACFIHDGGPYLQLRRTGQQPFSVPEPAQGTVPVFPFPIRSGTWRNGHGRHPPNQPGHRRMLPSHGMRRGNVLGLGSRILACTSPSAFTTPKDGPQVNWTWSSGGTARFELSTSNRVHLARPSLLRLNINYASTPGCGMKHTTGKP